MRSGPLTLNTNKHILPRMNQGGVLRSYAGFAAGCVAMLAIACSNYHPNKITFHFTPVPVVVSDRTLGTPVSIDPTTCDAFTADRVGVSVDAKERVNFERWLADIDFQVIGARTIATNDPAQFYDVRVPGGSVPDAITLITKQRGVRKAEPDLWTIRGSEYPPVGGALGCKTPVPQGAQQ